MRRLLDEDAVIKVLERWQKAFRENSHHVSASDLSLVVKDVRELPPAQPEPHEGRWINGKCDLCGEHAPFWCMASTYHESNYCPNCGARMKGVSNERTD